MEGLGDAVGIVAHERQLFAGTSRGEAQCASLDVAMSSAGLARTISRSARMETHSP
jgi:hypothetical protein